MDKPTDILEMSDEDFAKMAVPPVAEPAAVEPAVTEEQQPAPVVVPEVEAPAPTEEEEEEQPPVTEEQPGEQQQQPNQEEQPPEPALDAEGKPVVTPEAAPAEEEFDYKAAYENLIAKPIKANGKEIKLNSVEELVQLAQQGANYTRKMQDIAPHRKTLMLLENNDLLDPEKLAFLVDLQKKDPAAIQKFLKESGINPLDIDIEAEPNYRGGNHRVSDEEVAFRTAIDDMQMSESGQAVLQAIHGTWDQASKEQLVSQPGIMEIMRQQHEAGFYTRIAAEVDRRAALGMLPSGSSFLQNYKQVGDQLVAAGQMADLIEKSQSNVQTPPAKPAVPVAVRAAAPKPAVLPNPKADAAAPSKPAPNAAKKLVNPLEMSDDEFLKHFEKRL